MKTKSSIGPFLKEIIGLHIKEGCINWPRDMALAKRLYLKYPNIDFWRSLVIERSNSMAGLSTEAALNYIQKEWLKYTIEPSIIHTYKIEENKVGLDLIINHKPKSILEFIKA